MAVDAVKLYHRQHGKVALAGLSTIARGAAISGGSFAGYGTVTIDTIPICGSLHD